MTTTLWTKSSGYSLGTFPERIHVNIPLPINNISGISYSIISGELPPGLMISGNYISGNPFIVATNTTFMFCIRATTGFIISDRTFSITISGANPPEFVSQNSNLDIGIEHQFFAIDDTYVEYVIEATELLPSLRKDLSFFISDGYLPPGLTLSSTGVISGVVSTLKSTPPDNAQEIYTFTITVTDGFLNTSKQYNIYVVGPFYLTADNNSMLDANQIFTADVTSLRPIQWVTSGNLGAYRSNNYITIEIKTVDNSGLIFSIDNVNNLPPGLSFDSNTAIIYGKVPYQSFYSKTYNFTLTATRYNYFVGEYTRTSKTFTIELIGDINNDITWDNIQGSGAILSAKLGFNNTVGSSQEDQVESIAVVHGGKGYPDSTLMVVVPTNGGKNAHAYCSILNGSIYSTNVTYPGSEYITPPNVLLTQQIGVLQLFQPSTLHVSATSSVPNSVLRYRLVSGELPPGLRLTDDGEIIGSVDEVPLTTFDCVIDNDTTIMDGEYVFIVEAYNQYGSSLQAFSILINALNKISYNNIYVKPLLVKHQRIQWNEFIKNITVFPLDKIYRIYDKNFGFNEELLMLIFSGIESSTLDTYVNAALINNNKKRFTFNGIKSAIAKDIDTNSEIYEVIYVEMTDPREYLGKHLPLEFNYNNLTYCSNSVTNWQLAISNATTTNGYKLTNNQSLLPLWMKTMTETQVPGFVLAVPICYCKVGTSADIILNINNYINDTSNNFNFNNIDYTADRYIISNVQGQIGQQYLVFNNNRTTI